MINLTVSCIAQKLVSFGGNLAAFAYSPDAVDQAHASAIRRQAAELAKSMVGQSEETVEEVAKALDAVCAGDRYATLEIAGRFRSGVRRARLLAEVARHPRAARFASLVDAISSGKYSKAQWQLAIKLAAEVA